MRWKYCRYGLVSLLLLLTACAGSTKTAYYTLGDTADGHSVAIKPGMSIPSLGVGPVDLPNLLDRQAIVLRKDAYTVEVAELHEWAGQLEDEFVRALAQRFQHYLPATDIRRVPWELEQTPKYQISVTVSRFDGAPGGQARLQARWQLQLAANGKGLRSGSFDQLKQTGDDSIAALVKAESQLIDDLARKILLALK